MAKSEPPRLKDVPAHVKCLKKYGGGISQFLILDTLKVLEELMPDNRIVSGNFFEFLTTLKLPPDQLMPRMIHACVLLQATHKSERECVGNVVTHAHVKSLASDKLKAKALHCNDVLNKAAELAAAMPEGVSSTQVSVEIGRTAIELAKCIFGLDSTFKSIDDISKSLVDKLAFGKSASSVAETQKDAEVTQNVFEFQPDGSCTNAGKITAQGVGFEKSTLIEPKRNNTFDDSQYAIAYINEDGSASVKKILSDGSEAKEIIVIKLDDLIANYKQCKSRIKLCNEYPANYAEGSDAMQQIVDKGSIAMAFRKACSDSRYNGDRLPCSAVSQQQVVRACIRSCRRVAARSADVQDRCTTEDCNVIL